MDKILIEQLGVIAEEFEANGRPAPKDIIDETIKQLEATNDSKPDCYYALTVQALHMRNEVFWMGGMGIDEFTKTYLNGLGDYERKVAQKEEIEIDE